MEKKQTSDGRKAPKPLLFIDTNIFLDFYRAESKASLSLLQHVESVPELLITTDQVEMEFLKNRQRVISAALQDLKAPSVPPFIPAYLVDSRAASGIEKNLAVIKARVASLKKRLAHILEDPGVHDPVFKTVKKAFSAQTSINLKHCETKREKVFERALRRFYRGFPPRKREDTSLGDAINWEWIIECASEKRSDVLIVSRDGDFGLRFDSKHYLNDWLQQEFRERVSSKRHIKFTTSLALALRNVAVPVTKAEEEGEQEILAQRMEPLGQPPLDIHMLWHQLTGHLSNVSMFLRSYLSNAVPVSLQDNILTVGYAPEFEDQLTLVDNARNHALLQSKLKEMGMDGMQVKFVKLRNSALPKADPPASAQVFEEDVPF